MTQAKQARHILSLSGGKDSAALAVYMRDRVPSMEYIFHDTDKELPETYAYLDRLQAVLGKPIQKTTSEHSFDNFLKLYGGMIPSNHRRWCTRQLKLKPFEKFVGSDTVYNYIGLRADEDRQGYISHRPNIIPVYPFRDDGLVYRDIIAILENSGLGLPGYTQWGRTRSGCFFCFYQQRIEWVRLREKYPDLYEQAKKYEQLNPITGTTFYWNQTESLAELEQPARMEEIKLKAETKKTRSGTSSNLVQILTDTAVDDEEEPNGCLICQL